MKIPVDVAAVSIAHIPLVYFVVADVAGRLRALLPKKGMHAILRAKRGDKTMSLVWALYGVSTVAYSLAVSVAENLGPWKPAIILFDYLVLTYLFFSSSWFRNRILLRFFARVDED